MNGRGWFYVIHTNNNESLWGWLYASGIIIPTTMRDISGTMSLIVKHISGTTYHQAPKLTKSVSQHCISTFNLPRSGKEV